MDNNQYHCPDGSGCVMGDTKPMPMRDSVNVTDTYGADVGMDAKNRIGSIAGTSKSDEADYA